MIQEIYPHRFNNHYVADMQIGDNDFILQFKDNSLLLKAQNDAFAIPQKKDFSTIDSQTKYTYLFSIDTIACFLVWDDLQGENPFFIYKEINFFRMIPQKEVAWAAIVGFHLRNWYAEHRFCGKCGTKTHHKRDERAMVCPECQTLFFPKISPAIIVAITCKDKIVLARNTAFRAGWYSLIAGYADVGETLEETVIREVKEEIGLQIRNIRYYKSQPWPLSGSMMVGFIAEADENQPITIDHDEIAEAAWFTRGNLPDHSSDISIGGELIELFEKGKF